MSPPLDGSTRLVNPKQERTWEVPVDEVGGQVVVAGWMDYPGHRDDVLAAARELTKATLAEPGCLGYAFSADADNPDRILVFERWTSAAELTAHLGLPHVLDFRAAISGFPRSGKSVHQFQVCGVRSI